MAKDRITAKGRRDGGAFVPIPIAVLTHPNFKALSYSGCKLLCALFQQLKMKGGGPSNNGDLCATYSMMKEYGFSGSGTLSAAKAELLHYGFVIVTRQGEILRNDKPTLYAITWWAINDCNGKLDVSATQVAPGNWKAEKPKFVKPYVRSKDKIPSLKVIR